MFIFRMTWKLGQIIPGKNFHLLFDTREIRVVDVRPRVTGDFVSGMRMKESIADPSTVTIVGPKRRIEKVEAATTDPVDATGTTTRSTFMTQAYVPDPLIQVLHATPIRVTVIMEGSEDKK